MTLTDPFTKGAIPDGDGTLWIDSVTVVGLGSVEARREGGNHPDLEGGSGIDNYLWGRAVPPEGISERRSRKWRPLA